MKTYINYSTNQDLEFELEGRINYLIWTSFYTMIDNTVA